MPGRIVLVGVLLLLLLAGPTARTARAHTPPPIYISVSVDEEEVTWEMTVSAAIFEDWFSVPAKDLNELEGEALDALRAAVEAFVVEWGGVSIDGVPVKGVLRSARYEAFLDHEIQWDYVQIRMAYAAKGMPHQVALVWRNFNGGLGGYFASVASEIEGRGETEYYVFRESEPEVVWHAPREERSRTPPALPRVTGPQSLTVPWLTAALLALGALAAFALRRRRPALRTLAVVATLGLGLGLSEVALGDVPLPWARSVQRPSEAEAAQIFESLLRNIYRAFDYDDEETVYDTLAHTVTGELLEDLYLEIHGSLILQDAGGAVSKVQKVELVDTVLLPAQPDQGAWFELEARWRVQGKVGHWGHTHVRLNEYKARFTVTEAAGGWKIADLQLLGEERLDDGSLGDR